MAFHKNDFNIYKKLFRFTRLSMPLKKFDVKCELTANFSINIIRSKMLLARIRSSEIVIRLFIGHSGDRVVLGEIPKWKRGHFIVVHS